MPATEDIVAAIEFIVPGNPEGKGRPLARRTRKGVQMRTPPKTLRYEWNASQAAKEVMGDRPLLATAVHVALAIVVPVPASWSLVRQRKAVAGEILPVSKPDIDNVEKAIFDALNGVCWKDDIVVTDVVKSKRYGLVPCVHVRITPHATNVGKSNV